MDNAEIDKEITSFVTLLIDGESSCYYRSVSGALWCDKLAWFALMLLVLLFHILELLRGIKHTLCQQALTRDIVSAVFLIYNVLQECRIPPPSMLLYSTISGLL